MKNYKPYLAAAGMGALFGVGAFFVSGVAGLIGALAIGTTTATGMLATVLAGMHIASRLERNDEKIKALPCNRLGARTTQATAGIATFVCLTKVFTAFTGGYDQGTPQAFGVSPTQKDLNEICARADVTTATITGTENGKEYVFTCPKK